MFEVLKRIWENVVVLPLSSVFAESLESLEGVFFLKILKRIED